MRAEERIAQLESENAALRAENAALREERTILVQQMEHLLARLQEVEGRLVKDSHNSSKPPSSDGPACKRGRRRAKSGKKTGGQPGHPGRTRLQVAKPEEIVRHRPAVCLHCQQSLEAVAGQVKERRQVHDLPVMRVVVQEHQVEEVCCPACQHLNVGSFPPGVQAPVQYGPNVQALGVYLHQYQLVPLGRTCELLEDLYDCHVSEATLVSWVQIASTSLEASVARIAEWLSVSRVLHGDETGLRMLGKRHWLHVASTRWLTHLAWHPKRGKAALEAIGIWPGFGGRAMHDRLSSYDHYPCAHSIC